MSDAQLLRVNLGCGTRYHPDWANYDLTPAGPGVRQANFIGGIPLPGGAASCVYHSHVLEHLPLDLGKRFLAECLRVLAPGGILRVVPDLEQSARDYLDVLAARRQGRSSPADHYWMLLELFDQMVRTRSGGQWVDALAAKAGNDDFIAPRLGAYGMQLMDDVRKAQPARRSLKHRVWKRALSILPGGLSTTLDQVRYRRSGEIHLWMYDDLFLQDVLKEVGFADPKRMTAHTSDIPDFATYALDVEAGGTPWKGVSLYMEARRPTT